MTIKLQLKGVWGGVLGPGALREGDQLGRTLLLRQREGCLSRRHCWARLILSFWIEKVIRFFGKTDVYVFFNEVFEYVYVNSRLVLCMISFAKISVVFPCVPYLFLITNFIIPVYLR